ncbi:MAG TPA: tol-pal system protein YbgF [Candidatus Binatia bacterium]|nr:tol-pal system protein YbgF [Candidatus Binatia bacterium]
MRTPASRHAAPLALALVLAGAAAGCAPGNYYRDTQAQLDSLLTTQADLVRRVDRLDRKLEETRGGMSSTRASTETNLAKLSERLDVVVSQLERNQERMQDFGLKIDTVRQRMNAADSARVAQGMAPADTSGILDPEQAYQAAYSDYAAGRYKLAGEAFREFLRHYPNTEVSDNAQYWIGESLYAQGDFPSAIIEFRAVVDNYPKGDKVPAALLKIGIANARLNNTAEARKSFDQVIRKYPRSPEAALAKERLAQLR